MTEERMTTDQAADALAAFMADLEKWLGCGQYPWRKAWIKSTLLALVGQPGPGPSTCATCECVIGNCDHVGCNCAPGPSAPPTDFAAADAWYDKHAELYQLDLLEPRALVRFAFEQAALSSRESRAAGAWTETELAGAFVAAGAYENLARALARIAIAGPK